MHYQNDVKLDMVDGGMDGIPVEGSMSFQPTTNSDIADPNFSSLDEPIRDTIMRDLKAVFTKFKHVIHPTEKKSLLKEWDLWGPLLLCTFIAMVLQGDDNAQDFHDGGPEFAEVFVIVWVGSIIVTINSKLLGGNISFFQSVCVLGYCLLPMAVALIICKLLLHLEGHLDFGIFSHIIMVTRFITTVAALYWTCKAAHKFLADIHSDERRGLAMYPIFLFYAIIGWLVLSYSIEYPTLPVVISTTVHPNLPVNVNTTTHSATK